MILFQFCDVASLGHCPKTKKIVPQVHNLVNFFRVNFPKIGEEFFFLNIIFFTVLKISEIYIQFARMRKLDFSLDFA
jgi:hypothetical protein